MKSNLRKIMDDRQTSVRVLAAGSGVSLSTVHKATTDRIMECSISTLKRLASALNVQVSDLFEE